MLYSLVTIDTLLPCTGSLQNLLIRQDHNSAFWPSRSHCPNTSPWNHHSTLCFCKFDYLDSPNKWSHTMFIFLWLAYFIENNIFQVHPCSPEWHDFTLKKKVNNIPVCIYTPYSFCIHPSRHFYLHILATVAPAAQSCCNEHESVSVSLRSWFQLLWKNTQSGFPSSCDSSSFLKDQPYCLIEV